MRPLIVMSGTPHSKLRPATGQRPNLETPAYCLRTFPHRHHAESGLRLVGGIFHAVEADSIVLHGHHVLATRMIERNFDVVSAGVLRDVEIDRKSTRLNSSH